MVVPNWEREMDTTEALSRALLILEEDGWIQNRYCDEENGGNCMASAVYKAIDMPWREGLPLFQNVARALCQQTGRMNMALWNDNPDRTFSEVREVFRRAIAETGGIAREQTELTLSV
jgi:hypothetical protein